MTPVLMTFAGLLGLVIGSFLNVVIARVPAGVSLLRESRCPRCDSAIGSWQNVPVVSWLLLRGRCRACGEPISVRYPLVELATAALFAAVAWWVLAPEAANLAAGIFTFAAFAWFAAASVALALIDLDTRRLPNVIVLPSLIVLAALLAAAAIASGDVAALGRAAIGGAALYAFYLLLTIIRPGAMGGGDVKLAAVVGLMLAWVGWGAFTVGAFAAFLLGGVVGLALMVRGQATRKTAIPFGPFMLVGAWLGIFFGTAIADTYLRLTGLIA